jgi:DNA-binding NarL/FixJ family response regulator
VKDVNKAIRRKSRPKTIPRTKPYRVLIVDDHPIVRNGLRQLIQRESDLVVCGEAGNTADDKTVIAASKPDVALVDISLEGTNGIELTKMIRASNPEVEVVVLSMHDESLYAERALRAGAKAYVMKQEAPERVLKAIRKVLQGELYVSDNVASRLLQAIMENPRSARSPTGVDRLSDRELEIFQFLGRGKGTRQIAKALQLSAKTVETYRAHIKRKLMLKDATELIQHAVSWVENEGNGR